MIKRKQNKLWAMENTLSKIQENEKRIRKMMQENANTEAEVQKLTRKDLKRHTENMCQNIEEAKERVDMRFYYKQQELLQGSVNQIDNVLKIKMEK